MKWILLGCFQMMGILGSWAQVEAPEFGPGKEGLNEMMVYLLQANEDERILFGTSLFPTKEDCDEVFMPEVSGKVFRYQKYLRRQAAIVIQPLAPFQTDFLIWTASTAQLKEYVEEAKYFPGGYHELAPHLKNGHTFYRIKFVQPGHKIGSAFDVLVFVNGHWRLFQRPWTVLFYVV